MLEVENLGYTYTRRRGGVPSLSDLSFRAEAGHMVFVLGPNGSGKSTLFRLLLKLLRLQQGSVRIDGKSLATMSHTELARRVSYIPQQHDVTFNFTVLDTVLMGRTARMGMWSNTMTDHDRARAYEALDTLGIAHLARRGLRELSGGERQLVLTARALCKEGRLLVLDEPTSNLDYGNQERVLGEISRLAEMGYLVLVSSHNPMHALQYGNRLLLLREGRCIGDGPPADIDEDLLSSLYGTPIRLVSPIQAPNVRMCLPAAALTSQRKRAE